MLPVLRVTADALARKTPSDTWTYQRNLELEVAIHGTSNPWTLTHRPLNVDRWPLARIHGPSSKAARPVRRLSACPRSFGGNIRVNTVFASKKLQCEAGEVLVRSTGSRSNAYRYRR